MISGETLVSDDLILHLMSLILGIRDKARSFASLFDITDISFRLSLSI